MTNYIDYNNCIIDVILFNSKYIFCDVLKFKKNRIYFDCISSLKKENVIFLLFHSFLSANDV